MKTLLPAVFSSQLSDVSSVALARTASCDNARSRRTLDIFLPRTLRVQVHDELVAVSDGVLAPLCTKRVLVPKSLVAVVIIIMIIIIIVVVIVVDVYRLRI